MAETNTIICSNTACKRTFNHALKTVNLHQNPTAPYDACPFCLTPVNSQALEDNSKPEAEPVEIAAADKVETAPKEKPLDCRHHLGYLSGRAQKEQIPDDCLICKEIVSCMMGHTRDPQ